MVNGSHGIDLTRRSDLTWIYSYEENKLSTLTTITELMRQRLSLTTEKLEPTQTLDELGVDSLALIEFMFDVEDALGISFDDQQVNVTTVQDVVNLVDQALAKRDSRLELQTA